jgi:phosphoribosylformylglycinamidine cyclo-ligase
MPEGLVATLDRSTWTPQPIFDVVRRVGSVEQADLERTLNLGVGMVALTAAEDADRALTLLDGHGVRAWVAGHVSTGQGGPTVALTGNHPGWSAPTP